MIYRAQDRHALSDAENEGWPLAGTSRKTSSSSISNGAPDGSLEQAMARFGITRVSVDYFHYGNFRYSKLADAIAQAQRESGGATLRSISGATGTSRVTQILT